MVAEKISKNAEILSKAKLKMHQSGQGATKERKAAINQCLPIMQMQIDEALNFLRLKK